MDAFDSFRRGMGIGGWLTNYKRFNLLKDEWRTTLTTGDFEHFDSYITEADIAYIAGLGMDHVRLGFDQLVLEDAPFHYREQILARLDDFVRWCKTYSLGCVLNLHKAIGNYCDIPSPVHLVDDPELRARFTSLWVLLEEHYAGDNQIVFELMNEMNDVDPAKWNSLADETLAAIRARNPERVVILGGTRCNHPSTLKEMRLFDDPHVVYTFHFYDPFEFTHQRGVLQPATLFYNREMPWPADPAYYHDFRRTVGWDDPYGKYAEMNADVLRDFMIGAREFQAAHPDKRLWCGEFGTIRHAQLASRENWMRDVISILRDWDIPYCVWNYLSTPNDGNRFSLVDDDNRKILSARMRTIIRGEA